MKVFTKRKPEFLKNINTNADFKKHTSRRALLERLLLRYNAEEKPKNYFDGPSTKGIDPYVGPWTLQEAGHLLRRATFGPTRAQIEIALNQGLNTTVNSLLAPQPEPGPPLNPNYTGDSNVPVGSTWLNMPFIPAVEDEQYEYRMESIRGWQYIQLLEEGSSITETMTLFWHNHFATGDIDRPDALYRYIKLLRSQAVGNFKQLTKDISIDAAMLFYLNGNENIAEEPNENFARELLELFTIGKGPLVGPGDYTNYTEQDVVAIAKTMTGWWVDNEWSYDINNPLVVVFENDLHDQNTKQLSDRFGNATIASNGADEYKDLIDVLFQQAEVARYIVRKLYRWFVYYDINATVEEKVIEPLAQIMIANDFELKPVLETLLKSEHFYDVLSMGCVIKNPIDYNLSMLKQFEIKSPQDLENKYKWNTYIFYISGEFGMEYFLPPSVAGWKAYYQVPNFYRLWINAVTLGNRKGTSGAFVYGFEDDGLTFGFDAFAFIQALDNPSDPNELVDQITKMLLPMPLTASQKTFLKSEVLIPGLPDSEWTMEYNTYLASPNDANLKAALDGRIQDLLFMISVLPDYHLK